jgi:phosphoribosyl-dephospho-CoA transferase
MFARHDLVWLSRQGWQHARGTAPAHCHDAIDRWRRADWPAIVRRNDAGLLSGWLAIGIALPPDPVDGSKMRIGLRVPQDCIRKVLSPLPLGRVNRATPVAWRPLLAILDREAAGQGLAIGVYGSVALQGLTRQSYLTAASDIDLLLRPRTRAQLIGSLDLLESHAGKLPLDGEIVFPGGQAVAWKELSAALRKASGTRVLVKQLHGISLSAASALVAALKDEPCMT